MKTYRHDTTIISLENVRKLGIYSANQFVRQGTVFTRYYLQVVYNNNSIEDIYLCNNMTETEIKEILDEIQEILEK